MLVVLGGPMSAHDTAALPWLVAEKKLIHAALADGKRICGICLAQLIAEALGGQVVRNKHMEIGWHPVELFEADSFLGTIPAPQRIDVFQWHGETFTIPSGAVRLARSQACENQAFTFGDRVLALQFHPEATVDSIRQLVEHCGDELVPGPFIHSAEAILSGCDRIASANELLSRMLDRFCVTRERA